VIEEPNVLVYDKKVSAASDIVPLLEKLVQLSTASCGSQAARAAYIARTVSGGIHSW